MHSHTQGGKSTGDTAAQWTWVPPDVDESDDEVEFAQGQKSSTGLGCPSETLPPVPPIGSSCQSQ
jgi:hypothetical protein